MGIGSADISQGGHRPAGLRGGEAAPSFASRVRSNAASHTLIANPVVLGLFCLLRWLHLIALEPYWLYAAVVLGGGLTSIVAAACFEHSNRRWCVDAHIAVNMAVIGVVAYSTGWGAILSIGFLFGAAASIQLFGSKATWPCIIWTAIVMTTGQLAIAFLSLRHLSMNLLFTGLPGSASSAALLVIELLGHVTAAREVVEAELRQSGRRFKALVSNAADIIIVTDQNGVMQYVSPAFERVLGHSGPTSMSPWGRSCTPMTAPGWHVSSPRYSTTLHRCYEQSYG